MSHSVVRTDHLVNENETSAHQPNTSSNGEQLNLLVDNTGSQFQGNYCQDIGQHSNNFEAIISGQTNAPTTSNCANELFYYDSVHHLDNINPSIGASFQWESTNIDTDHQRHTDSSMHKCSHPNTINTESIPLNYNQIASVTPSETKIEINLASNHLSNQSASSHLSADNRQGKPVSAYALFFRDTQASIKTENPTASFGEISKIVASKWDSLPKTKKDVYKERADLEKRNYLQNLASNKAKEIASNSNDLACPMPISDSNENQSSMNEILLSANDSIKTVAIDHSGSSISSSSYLENNESNPTHSQQRIIMSATELDATNNLDLRYVGPSSSSMPIIDDSIVNQNPLNMVESATLNAYNAFNFELNENCYENALNSDLNTGDTFDPVSQQFVEENKTSSTLTSSFPFNDDTEFFDTATDNIIDLGLDLNELEDIRLLSEQIYSSSVFDGSSMNSNGIDFLDSLSMTQETSTNQMPSLQPFKSIMQSNSNELGMSSKNYSRNDPIVKGSNEFHLEKNDYSADFVGFPNENNIVEGCITDKLNQSESICAKQGCQNRSIDSSQWDGEFCSEECCVKHCADVFRAWTSNRSTNRTNNVATFII
ncbi:TOX high mobility group box family member 4-A [Sarcoptes scabiei]|uniref:TOX high mobility group box family member 4-A n=1 Tax=Sarcoptes scabiei TaxID=52283 RepID=A0A834VHK4_SARSC|nr:TOX high mobility group box family member 4-A [Sarcoptes scabiei]